MSRARVLVLWCPGWPVIAWARAGQHSTDRPVAVVAAHVVTACSLSAREEGVFPGQRQRQAQACCPDLQVVAANEACEISEFATVLATVESLTAVVQAIRPGLCALPCSGPAGRHGGEPAAAEALLAAVAGLGVEARIGIADDRFTAEQAAMGASPIRIVEAGGSAQFLRDLPVHRLGDPDLSGLLPRLGVHTLGEFADLPCDKLVERFGQRGRWWHRLAGGGDTREVIARQPPAELVRELLLEPPLILADQVAFSLRSCAEEFIAAVSSAGLACTGLRIVITQETGQQVVREWLHPSLFDPAAVVDRLRWQIQAASGRELVSGVTGIRLEPVGTDDLADHTPGLFGGVQQRVDHVLSRVQAMLGHDAVATVVISGGRRPVDRQQLIPWGDRPGSSAPSERPWPGRLPAPLPATLLDEPAVLLDAEGRQVVLDSRAGLVSEPVLIEVGGEYLAITGWAGPWPLVERPWLPHGPARSDRFQVIDERGTAWLVVCRDSRWFLEGRYD